MDASRRQFVRPRAAGLCEYYHLAQEPSELVFQIEHIIPRQHAKDDSVENLAVACRSCNFVKDECAHRLRVRALLLALGRLR
jgi:5-methylcytosine-specific restriction endonuclease McrA